MTTDDGFSAFFERNPVPMWIYEAPGMRLLAANPAAAELYGYSVGEMSGRPLRDLHPDDDEAGFEAGAGRRVVTYVHRAKSGRVLHVEVSSAPIVWQGRPARLAVGHDITGHVQTLADLRRNERLLAHAQRIGRMGSWEWEIGAERINWSPLVYELCGRRPDPGGIHKNDFIALVHPDDRARVRDAFQGAGARGEPLSFDHRVILDTGEERVIHQEGDILRDADGRPCVIAGFAQDITERKRTDLALLQSEERLSSILGAMVDVVWSVAPDSLAPLYFNLAAAAIYGHSPERLVQEPSLWRDCVHEDDRAAFDQALLALQRQGSMDLEYRIRHRDGSLRWLHSRGQAVCNNESRLCRLDGITADITERKAAQDRIQYLASRDLLTELPNRNLLQYRLDFAIDHARRFDRPLALLFIGLDRFILVNDGLGPDRGDQLLKTTARRLQAVLAEGDTVARVGGDEFVVLLEEDAADLDHVAALAQRLLGAVRAPVVIDGHELVATASMGISLYPRDGATAQELLRNSNAAMHEAKATGGDSFRFHQAEVNRKIVHRLLLESELRRAVDRDEFQLVYQPRVDLASGAVLGAEALLRWRHPERGVVPPLEFIPLAEEIGLILPIGQWVLRTACRQWRAWRDAGLPPVRLSVNLSAQQLAVADAVARVEQVLAQTGMDPAFLELEITESSLMRDLEGSRAVLKALRDLGLRLAMDDFGTGYSSLNYLRSLPIDVLKIDRTFISEIEGEDDEAPIVEATLAMARSLSLRVVAEGVETEAQRAYLARRRCDEGQGYLFSRPMEPEALAALLAGRPVGAG